MRSIGLHFGHDASGVALDDNGIVAFLNKERRSRIKHAIGLSTADLREILAHADEGTYLGITSTQELPILHDSDVQLVIDSAEVCDGSAYVGRLGSDDPYRKFLAWMKDTSNLRGLLVRENQFALQSRLSVGFNQSYEALGMLGQQTLDLAFAMHRDLQLTLDGRLFNGRYYQHHYAHACYAGYTATPARPAIIITGDGSFGPTFAGGGIYFWTPGQKLLAVTPVDGWLGGFYSAVAEAVGLDAAGGAGKLMGLAPYGRPIYADHHLIGTWRQVSRDYTLPVGHVIRAWFSRHDIDEAKLKAWDSWADAPPSLAADVAASAQLLLEQNILQIMKAAKSIAARAGFEYEAIALSGGLALNCPANSNLVATQDVPVVVPPAVNDEGLSIGAAVAIHHDATSAYPKYAPNFAEAVYIGSDVDEASVRAACDAHGWRQVEADEAVLAACRLLLDDKAVGLCTGRSEVGPRALGHRTILANPCSTESWSAVNKLKRREPWRPFAPAVLKDETHRYFDRGPADSRYMLFNYRCITKELPAVTHYDHSSRIQQVSEETGLLYTVLRQMADLGAPPVLMNTSFNGPGVPIVETANDAFEEASKIGLDYILTDFGLFTSLAA